jgi:hypothetical protein
MWPGGTIVSFTTSLKNLDSCRNRTVSPSFTSVVSLPSTAIRTWNESFQCESEASLYHGDNAFDNEPICVTRVDTHYDIALLEESELRRQGIAYEEVTEHIEGRQHRPSSRLQARRAIIKLDSSEKNDKRNATELTQVQNAT